MDTTALQSASFRGFRRARVTDAAGNYKEHTFDPTVDALQGRGLEVREYDSAGTLYATHGTTWRISSLPGGVSFPYIQSEEHDQYDGQSTPSRTLTGYQYDQYGNPTIINYIGDYDDPNDNTYLEIEYTYNLSAHIVNTPSHKTQRAGGINRKESWLYYDGHTSWTAPPERGSVTKLEDWLEGGTNPFVTMAYDEYGNVVQAINARGFSARTAYDAQYRTYPVKLINALNQITSYVYTASSPYGGMDGFLIGQPNAVTDANGQTAHTAFDPLGRASATYAPGETCPSTAYTYDNFSPGGSDRRFYVKSRARKYSGCAEEYLILYTFFDGLARPVQTKQLNGDSPDNQIINGTRSFNNRGLVEREYVPYQASDINKDLFEPPVSTPYISYSYDAIGRPVSVVRPDGGQTTVAYDRRKTTVTDANGHSRATVVDAFGRVAQVLEYNAGQTYTTSYTYTPLGQLSTLTDALGHQATMRYDSLGRKIELADFDMGTLSYSYDAAANQVSQTDSRGVAIRFEYDALNRLTRKDYPAGRDTTYVYDSCAFGVGRVCQVRDASGWESYTYDNLGRVVAATKALDGQLYTTQTEYDLLGRTLSVTYPDRQTVTYGYDAAGRLQSVSGGPQGTGYIHDISYNPLGQVTQVFYNNGVTSRYVYEDQTYRLKEINTTNNVGGTLQALSYSFDAVGNITSIEDLVAGNRQAFAYDDLDRLTRAALTASGGAVLEDIVYAYDAIGNLRNKGGIVYAYDDPQHVHAVSSTSDGRNYTYDANGNLLSDGLRSFTYDYDNRPVRIAVRQPNSQMTPELPRRRRRVHLRCRRKEGQKGHSEWRQDALRRRPVRGEQTLEGAPYLRRRPPDRIERQPWADLFPARR